MSKRDSAPTIGWVIASTFYKYVAVCFFVILFIAGAGIFLVWRELDVNCDKSFKPVINVFKYSITIEARKTCGL